ncbi:hypothetical protein ACJJTC_002254 [Scirpophaga incertulas]
MSDTVTLQSLDKQLRRMPALRVRRSRAEEEALLTPRADNKTFKEIAIDISTLADRDSVEIIFVVTSQEMSYGDAATWSRVGRPGYYPARRSLQRPPAPQLQWPMR